MGFFGDGTETVYRDRRPLHPDPVNPGRQVPGTWSEALDTVALPGCYVATTSTSMIPNNARKEGVVYKSLFIPNVGADVRTGDRIRQVLASGDDFAYQVDQIPAADRNPWTGWQPVLEVPLQGFKG